MVRCSWICASLLWGAACTSAAFSEDADVKVRYEFGLDSLRQEGVPQGTITEHSWSNSTVYPGTIRRYWVYVPAQYDAQRDAALMVFQDGHAYVRERGEFRTSIVFDNLIHQGAMPVVIGVFVMHGRVKAPSEQALDRFNRSFEYDGLGDNYVRFLLEELLPDVEKKTATDGRPVRLLGCYHVSPHNTYTGRLTPAMLDEILLSARVMT